MKIFLIVVIIATLYFVHAWYVENQERKSIAISKQREERALDGIKYLIKPHARTLAIKYNQKIYEDDYGNFIFDDWDREVSYFIENVVLRDSAAYDFLAGGEDSYVNEYRLIEVSNLIAEVANAECIKMVTEEKDEYVEVDDFTGEEFEEFCVSILSEIGWDARKTKSTGDQGVDIIGKLNGIRTVFQCKRYSQPVGNSAVQEAIAGQKFVRAEVAVVVTNNTFTKSARQLAKAANVYLLHYTELEEFSEMFFGQE